MRSQVVRELRASDLSAPVSVKSLDVRALPPPRFISSEIADLLPCYEFEFDFAIALDTKNGLIFSFVWNLQD